MISRQGHTRAGDHVWLDRLAKLMVAAGLALSLYDFGGLKTANQFLGVGIAAGFLLGTYLLAKANLQGYIWLMVGKVNAAALMMRQGYYVLMIQQLLSLTLVIDAYRIRRQKSKQRP